jgi:hypothetical protein
VSAQFWAKMASTESGKWLQDALLDLCSKVESGLLLDYDLITGLVSYCELAAPEDAKEYLTVSACISLVDVIVGHDNGYRIDCFIPIFYISDSVCQD